MLDNLFVNNALCKALSSLVNFCNEQSYFSQKQLKFLEKMPLKNNKQDSVYKTRFIFDSTQISGRSFK